MSEYYKNNKNYAKFLEKQETPAFSKYANSINDLAKEYNNPKVLDVGCGTGTALGMIENTSIHSITLHGVDINSETIKICKQKHLNCSVYDGITLPFPDTSIDIIGTFNVLEHTDNPIVFLDELYRVCRFSGYIIIACPNFLAITNSYHPNTDGVINKIKNISKTVKKLIHREPQMSYMKPYTLEMIPDHDACVETNPLDILNWSRSKNLKTEYWSSSQYPNPHFLKSLLDVVPFKLFLGSCYFIFKK